jgi:hypothetical protein
MPHSLLRERTPAGIHAGSCRSRPEHLGRLPAHRPTGQESSRRRVPIARVPHAALPAASRAPNLCSPDRRPADHPPANPPSQHVSTSIADHAVRGRRPFRLSEVRPATALNAHRAHHRLRRRRKLREQHRQQALGQVHRRRHIQGDQRNSASGCVSGRTPGPARHGVEGRRVDGPAHLQN